MYDSLSKNVKRQTQKKSYICLSIRIRIPHPPSGHLSGPHSHLEHAELKSCWRKFFIEDYVWNHDYIIHRVLDSEEKRNISVCNIINPPLTFIFTPRTKIQKNIQCFCAIVDKKVWKVPLFQHFPNKILNTFGVLKILILVQILYGGGGKIFDTN